MGQHAFRGQPHGEDVRAVLARIEAAAITAPDSLTGEAREMFDVIARANHSRPWQQGHAEALADYCRVTVAWRVQFDALEREGPSRADSKGPNPRFRALTYYGSERLRLAKLLGLAVGGRDSFDARNTRADATIRATAGNMVQTRTHADGDLLA